MARRMARSRKKGWKKPAGSVYVGRPSKWGNPFVVGEPFKDAEMLIAIGEMNPDNSAVFMRYWMGREVPTADEAVRLYRRYVDWAVAERRLDLRELVGKDLLCWCPQDQPCHADVLMVRARRLTAGVRKREGRHRKMLSTLMRATDIDEEFTNASIVGALPRHPSPSAVAQHLRHPDAKRYFKYLGKGKWKRIA